MEWRKLLVSAAGAAGVAAILYYLLREETEAFPEEEKKKTLRSRKDNISKEDVVKLLQDIIDSQKDMKAQMKVLAKDIASGSLSFEQVYARVREGQPADPLDKWGLSIEDLDSILEKNHSDPAVMQMIARLMGGPDPNIASQPTQRSRELTVETITEIHVFMVEELQKFIRDFQNLSDKASYDMKTVTVVSQAILDSKVTAKFNVASEDMEGAIVANQQKLMKDQAFMSTHMRMQQTMQQLMSAA
mmetsp:Transcript_30215/g.66058  ORF Transcript_30215/g.66058 Transcript_30215/m.66058 type:complete len:245 (-) Transcript_30215:79-813(-)|eukprot:CAMPEP_0170613780 /NCGR_PEP_ID=MMETSP0224-20130122/24454_1 /TAXON_ID=285029 /ORGANISM="Togula jolla, Strain CCCM 725" /LENGTH=244 /DNA_ID=CAMNT_0010939403 /DNA_START=27 /DNA_END=761 /DNA_ORIENTATION=-